MIIYQLVRPVKFMFILTAAAACVTESQVSQTCEGLRFWNLRLGSWVLEFLYKFTPFKQQL